MAVAYHFLQAAAGEVIAEFCRGPQRQVVCAGFATAFDHQQFQWTPALYLQHEGTMHFQGSGQQHAGRHQLAQRDSQFIRVVVVLQGDGEALIQMHGVAANRRVVEGEAVEGVAILHGGRCG